MSGAISRIGFLLLLVACSVRAQNCPEGMVPEGGQGVASCAPSGNYAQPQGHWVNAWGAIATDVSKGAVGASYDQSDEQQAKMAAINNCTSNGGANCKIEITYGNSCVAMLQGDNGYTTGRAETIDKAIKIGMESCSKSGINNCAARYTSCSTAKWVQ
jgi:hypothetical protein